MTQKHKPGRDGLEQHQPQNPTATSLAPARTAPLAQAGGGQEAAESLASGAPPSNTAPDNCNEAISRPCAGGLIASIFPIPANSPANRCPPQGAKATRPIQRTRRSRQGPVSSGRPYLRSQGEGRFTLPLHPRRRRIPDPALPPGSQGPDGLCEGVGQIPGPCRPGRSGKTSLRSAVRTGRNPGIRQRQPHRSVCRFPVFGRYGKLGSSRLGDSRIRDQCLCRVR